MKSQYADSLPEGWAKFARFFSALGDPTRQKILLVFEPNEEICVNEIARLFHLSRPAISHHLKVLRNAELLLCKKRGKEVYYRVNYPYCAEVLRLVHGFVASKVNGEERVERIRPASHQVYG
jgi:DNA-binding transcriptional ArsR family regulator